MCEVSTLCSYVCTTHDYVLGRGFGPETRITQGVTVSKNIVHGPSVCTHHTLRVAVVCIALPLPIISQHMRKANLDPVHNHWRRVFDFSKDDTSLPNPHWSLMGERLSRGTSMQWFSLHFARAHIPPSG